MIKNFNISPINLPFLIDKIKNLDPKLNWVCNVREKELSRSDSQNSMYWDFITEFGEYLGYTKEEMHDVLRFKYLSNNIIVGNEMLPALRSTTKLNVKEFVTYFASIERWASELGFIWDGGMEWEKD